MCVGGGEYNQSNPSSAWTIEINEAEEELVITTIRVLQSPSYGKIVRVDTDDAVRWV